MAITSCSLPLKKQAAYSDYLINIQRAQTLPSGQISPRANRHESKKSLEVYQHLSLESVDKAYQDAVQTVGI